MAISVKDAQEKYADYLIAVTRLKTELMRVGIDVQEEGVWELEGMFRLYSRRIHFADFYWNTPYYQTFTSYVDQKLESYSDDNIKNIDEWERNILELVLSAEDFHRREHI